jgi:bleomycin hydrolase
VIEKLNLGDFQLAQNYLFFYDKLEKANYYLEYVTSDILRMVIDSLKEHDRPFGRRSRLEDHFVLE